MNRKFITIFFKDKLDNVNLVFDFFKGLLGNNIKTLENGNNVSVIFDASSDANFEEIASNLNTELFIPAKLFESRSFNNSESLNEYLEMVGKIDFSKFADYYFNEVDLINHHLGDYALIRQTILGKYEKDFEMLEVIKTFLDENMNISKAANKLYMHRNTVMNKIDKFIENTGYDIKKFKNAFIIYHLI